MEEESSNMPAGLATPGPDKLVINPPSFIIWQPNGPFTRD